VREISVIEEVTTQYKGSSFSSSNLSCYCIYFPSSLLSCTCFLPCLIVSFSFQWL